MAIAATTPPPSPRTAPSTPLTAAPTQFRPTTGSAAPRHRAIAMPDAPYIRRSARNSFHRSCSRTAASRLSFCTGVRVSSDQTM